MSVAGISSALPAATGTSGTPAVKATRQAEDQAANQLIQDLRSGNLNAAEQDYATLSGMGPNDSGPWSGPETSAAFQKLGQDLQSGDLSGARSTMTALASHQLQQDKAAVQQDYLSGNMAAYQQAMANLKGDTWAVYGAEQGQGPTSGSRGTSVVNVQA